MAAFAAHFTGGADWLQAARSRSWIRAGSSGDRRDCLPPLPGEKRVKTATRGWDVSARLREGCAPGLLAVCAHGRPHLRCLRGAGGVCWGRGLGDVGVSPEGASPLCLLPGNFRAPPPSPVPLSPLR